MMILTALLAIILVAQGQCDHNSRSLLFRDLFVDYNKYIIPDGPGGSQQNVSLDLTLLRATEPDSDVMTVSVWQSLGWNDARLRWDPELYDDIKELRVPRSLLWVPDVDISNIEDQPQAVADVNAVISPDGTVSLYIPRKLSVYVNENEDEQLVASFKYFSWTYSMSHLDLYAASRLGVDTSMFMAAKNGPMVVGASVVRNELAYSCCPEVYVDLTFTIVFGYEKISQYTSYDHDESDDQN